MKNNPFPIKQCNTLDLKFDGMGTAYSNNYGDIYFQPGMGLEEKKHVFLKGNHLPENWKNKKTFTIGETGFGLGLNFLNTLCLWQQNSQGNQHLHYISCELHPMNTVQLKQALVGFSELDCYSELLFKKYPQNLTYGFHRLHFNSHNVTLTLIFGDAVDAFKHCHAQIDAWFLDGFAPSKNAGMWSDDLFQALAKISHNGTTAATYTVARNIRDGLKSVGFEITKVKGFGQKREMLTAELMSKNKTINKQPWSQTFKATSVDSITVLGAGIAGLTVAQKLQQSGQPVTLIDRQTKPCLETSGNPQAMVMPSFDLNDSPESRFYLAAFNHAIHYYSTKYYHRVGVHQLAITDKLKKWQDQLLSRFDLPKHLLQLHKNGILYPQAGWLDTQGHARSIAKQVNRYVQAEITSIERKDDGWYLYTQDGDVYKTSCLILANGINALKLLPDYEVPLTPKHGEISYFNSADAGSQIADCLAIQLGKGYIIPSWKGEQTIGATFDHIDKKQWFIAPQSSEDHWQRNKKLWEDTEYFKLLNGISSHQSRAGIRVTTPDHLPVCGPVIDQQQFKQDYRDIRHGKQWKQYPEPKPLENLYLFTGLGSRGFTSAPILAEFLSNQIMGQPQVLDKSMQKSIHPNRFLFRDLKKMNRMVD